MRDLFTIGSLVFVIFRRTIKFWLSAWDFIGSFSNLRKKKRQGFPFVKERVGMSTGRVRAGPRRPGPDPHRSWPRTRDGLDLRGPQPARPV